MTDYVFRVLQPSEFECISRDLLQVRENVFIESFADGRDRGIDLRYAYKGALRALHTKGRKIAYLSLPREMEDG